MSLGDDICLRTAKRGLRFIRLVYQPLLRICSVIRISSWTSIPKVLGLTVQRFLQVIQRARMTMHFPVEGIYISASPPQHSESESAKGLFSIRQEPLRNLERIHPAILVYVPDENVRIDEEGVLLFVEFREAGLAE